MEITIAMTIMYVPTPGVSVVRQVVNSNAGGQNCFHVIQNLAVHLQMIFPVTRQMLLPTQKEVPAVEK